MKFFAPLLLATAVAAANSQVKGQQIPAETPIVNALKSHGCYKSKGILEDPKGYIESSVTSGYCNNEVCNKSNSTVLGLRGSTCYCGFEYPPEEDLVEDKNCNYPCPGYPYEACGSVSGTFYSIFNTGVRVDVDSSEPSSSSASTSSASEPTGASTTSAASNNGSEKKSTNVGGIVGGVVCGVVIALAAIGGVFFYLRRKRNKEIEEEHRRNAAVNSFIGHKPPSSSGGLSISDARLDPVMAQRRMSDGSIADNHDYSRKILRVTNA